MDASFISSNRSKFFRKIEMFELSWGIYMLFTVISIRITASVPYIRLNKVSLVGVCTVVLYAYKML